MNRSTVVRHRHQSLDLVMERSLCALAVKLKLDSWYCKLGPVNGSDQLTFEMTLLWRYCLLRGTSSKYSVRSGVLLGRSYVASRHPMIYGKVL